MQSTITGICQWVLLTWCSRLNCVGTDSKDYDPVLEGDCHG
jgi:hypothetical protein